MSPAGPGTNRFTPNGALVSSPVRRHRSASSAADRYPAARKPSPPPLLPAAASSGVDGPPASGASTIGMSQLSRIMLPSCTSSADARRGAGHGGENRWMDASRALIVLDMVDAEIIAYYERGLERDRLASGRQRIEFLRIWD